MLLKFNNKHLKKRLITIHILIISNLKSIKNMSLPLKNLLKLTRVFNPKYFKAQLACYSNEGAEKKDQMDHFRTNPYFTKYEDKLKAIYK